MNQADQVLNQQVQGNHTPSVQYVIFDRDRVIHSFLSGFADIQNKVPASGNTAYHFFSITKTFTALAVLQMAERKQLDPDHPAIEYLPSFPYPPEITVRQLLTHSAGIPNPIPLSWIHPAGDPGPFDRNAFFNRIFVRNLMIRSGPNEKFAYSNLGYVLLGLIIEQVSGVTYEEYIREQVLEPLGLFPRELGFIIPGDDRMAKGYHKKFSVSNLLLGFMMDKSRYLYKTEGQWKLFNDFYINGVSYGGLIGTSGACVRYIRELLNPESSLLSADYKRMLFTENITNSGKATGMCLSWFTGQLNGVPYFTHAGGGGGYYCEIRIYPEPGIGSAVLFNRTGMTDERFLDKIDKHFI